MPQEFYWDGRWASRSHPKTEPDIDPDMFIGGAIPNEELTIPSVVSVLVIMSVHYE